MSAPRAPSSPSHSPSISTSTRRLSSRRGSVSAPDPWGTFKENDRGIASVLHIIKAPSPNTEDIDERGHLSGKKSQHSSSPRHSRTQFGSSNRISFAGSGRGPSSPLSDGHHRRRSYFASAPPTELTARQVFDFAHNCTHPSDRPTSPGEDMPAPVKFVEVSDEHYLPFIDRPAEVKDLISSFPTHRLFQLLAQTFPPSCPRGRENDPTTWNYQQLESWLTETKREEINDAEWVLLASECIANKSELIWERIKAALGVPPELCSPSRDIIGPEMPEAEEAEAVDLDEEEVYIEPIISSPLTASPVHEFSGNELARVTLEDISEDGPDPAEECPVSPTICGLRIVNCPSPPPTRRFSIPRYASSPQSREPYDAVRERGPGNPLFPSNFGRLALEPTLQANNPASRRLSLPPASRFPRGDQRRVNKGSRSWAEGWDPTNQEYAVSIASTSSVGPT